MSTDSLYSSDSVETQQLVDTQTEILVKSQQIEKYIHRMKSFQNKSESFQFLETLFALFKYEVQVNISLRKSVLKQQQKYNEEIAELKERYNPQPFFDELSRLSQRDICDFNCALDLFSEISTIFLNAKNKLKTKLKNAKDDNEKLIQYGQDMQQCYEQLEGQVEMQNKEKDELQAKLDDLQKQLTESQQKNESLTKEIEALKKADEDANKVQQSKIEMLSQTVQALKKELNEVTEQLQTHQVQLAFEISQTETTTNQLKKEKTEKENLAAVLAKISRKEKEKKKAIDELKKKVKQLQIAYKEREKELQEQHQNEMNELKNKFNSCLNNKIDDIEAALNEKSERVQKIQQNLDQTTNKLKLAERKVKEQEQITLQYKEENERLRQRMRQRNFV